MAAQIASRTFAWFVPLCTALVLVLSNAHRCYGSGGRTEQSTNMATHAPDAATESEGVERSSSPALLGFQSLPADFTAPIPVMTVHGEIPTWLNTSLYRNGPALWNDELNHWFLGLAMLHVFHISAGQVSYNNHYLRTSAYEQAVNPDEKSSSQAAPSLNTPVTIRKAANHLLANTGATASNEFSPVDVTTIQAPFQFSGDIAGIQMAPSHAHTDPDGTIVHLYYTMHPVPGYQFYTIAPGTTERLLLGEVVAANPLAKAPAFMHTFALTRNYAVLSEVPGYIGPKGLFDTKYLPELGTTWYVVERSTGALHATLKGEAFFMYHHINAYEETNEKGEDEIVVDVVTYPNMDSLQVMFIKEMLRDGPQTLTKLFVEGGPHRFRLPISKGSSTNQEIVGKRLWEGGMEYPTIYYEKFNTRRYRYFYGASATKGESDFLDRLVKVDLDTPNPHGEGASALVWDGRQKACYPGEAIYVPRDPTSDVEDDGVVLSLVLDGIEKRSFLLVLDAKTFREVATAPLTYAVPHGFHGRHFFNATTMLAGQ